MLSRYDAWRLASPDDYPEIGTEDGEPCMRFPEPDEDMGRARPRRCTGTMVEEDGTVYCDTCGEIATTNHTGGRDGL